MRHDYRPEAGRLREFGRMAIWNKERVVVLIAIGVWVADVVFLIIGEYFLPIIEVFLINPVKLQVAYG